MNCNRETRPRAGKHQSVVDEALNQLVDHAFLAFIKIQAEIKRAPALVDFLHGHHDALRNAPAIELCPGRPRSMPRLHCTC